MNTQNIVIAHSEQCSHIVFVIFSELSKNGGVFFFITCHRWCDGAVPVSALSHNWLQKSIQHHLHNQEQQQQEEEEEEKPAVPSVISQQ